MTTLVTFAPDSIGAGEDSRAFTPLSFIILLLLQGLTSKALAIADYPFGGGDSARFAHESLNLWLKSIRLFDAQTRRAFAQHTAHDLRPALDGRLWPTLATVATTPHTFLINLAVTTEREATNTATAFDRPVLTAARSAVAPLLSALISWVRLFATRAASRLFCNTALGVSYFSSALFISLFAGLAGAARNRVATLHAALSGRSPHLQAASSQARPESASLFGGLHLAVAVTTHLASCCKGQRPVAPCLRLARRRVFA
ncbi:MAG: hypothetical protein ACO32I_07915, partial [Candidatus Limnocylindrus sp.]